VSVMAVAGASPAAGASAEFPHVLAGVVLDGEAARLAGMLDWAVLQEAGWDPAARILFLPAQHQLLGRQVCRAGGCAGTVHNDCPGVCYRCFTRLKRLGMSADDIAAVRQLPAAPVPVPECAVPGCRCKPTVRSAVMCEPHAQQFRGRRTPIPLGQFLTDRRVHPLPPLPACLVGACTRAADGAAGYCNTHYQRWRVAQQGSGMVDEQWWRATEPGVAEPGQVNLRALPVLVVVEMLAGLQTRLRAGLRMTDVVLRAAGDTVRRQQAISIRDCDPGLVPGKRARSVLRAFARDARRALADPGSEQSKDTWDLAVFGHPGTLSFTTITQPWLAAAKRWAAEQLPRHRGSGAARVQAKINSVGMLSQHLQARPGHGADPAALGRADLESFLSRLAYLEADGRISRYRRNMICRDVRAVLAGIRALGLTRPGRAAAGLAGDVTVERADIPADPERGEPGRDLPPEIMAALCASLHALESAEVRVATQIGIDTGRRPEDILNLPLDCLARDKDDGAVLIYDNVKVGRLGRRLPIGNATAEVIIAQQQRVRQRFPHAPAATLKLLPTSYRNPDGTKPISRSTLEARHRDWVSTLPPLRTSDGTAFDLARIVPYAYRHSYAQRHADAGVPIDVLAELLDHRSYSVTRGYYRNRRRPPPRRRRQGHRVQLRPARQPDLAGCPCPAGFRARPVRGRGSRRPLRHLHRAVQRPSWRRRLPHPVPLLL
jgi:integrase